MEERDLYQMYLEEADREEPCRQEELESLFIAKNNNDSAALERLIRGHLTHVVSVASAYADKGVAIEDLIQEGNIALMMLLQNCNRADLFLERLNPVLHTAMECAMDAEGASEKAGETLAATINVMNEVVTRLTEELGQEPTLDEIAAKMQSTPEDVKALMQIAVSAVSGSNLDE